MEHELFGHLEWDGVLEAWTGICSLPTFAQCRAKWIYPLEETEQEYLDRHDPHGKFAITVFCEPQTDAVGRPLRHRKTHGVIADSQVQAWQHFLENEARLFDSVLDAIFKMYTESYLPENKFVRQEKVLKGKLTPQQAKLIEDRFETVQGIIQTIELSSVTVKRREDAGYAYIGLCFRSNWEDEHGVGVVLHQDKILEVDYADCACEGW
jgi:hypothetical protein